MAETTKPSIVEDQFSPVTNQPYKVPGDLYIKESNGQIRFAGFPTPIKLSNTNNKDWFTYTHHALVISISAYYVSKEYILKEFPTLFPVIEALSITAIVSLILIFIVQAFPYNLKSFSRTFGRIISFKITSVRNFPNWDSNFTTSFILFSPVFILSISNKEVRGPVVAAFGLFLWNQMNRRSSIYNNCYNSYNKYLEKISSKKNDVDENEILANSLAIDLLHYDLWAHKSFSEFFIYEILTSLDCIIQNGEAQMIPSSLRAIHFSNGKKSLNRSELISRYIETSSFNEKDVDYILNLSFQIRNNKQCNRQNNIWLVPE